MPHMFINRPRLHNLTKGRGELRAHFRWEKINAVSYEIGGLLFIIGSIFFLPRFDAYVDLGAWIFFIGSLVYLVVTVHDLAEVRHYWSTDKSNGRDTFLDYAAAGSYVSGTAFFTVGSFFFLSEVAWIKAGAWLFIIGSLLFLLGSSINVLQIVKADSIRLLQLMNLTAITFIVGAVLFILASVPYLWDVAAQSDRTTLYAFLAWEYIVGSGLFLAGGVFNYRRAYQFLSDTGPRRRSIDVL